MQRDTVLPHVAESAPFWLVALEEYVPVLAAAVVTIVLARTGFQQRMTEYRRDTLDLIRLRSETLEKELADAHVENVQLQRELRNRDRRIDMLEEDCYGARQNQSPSSSPIRGSPVRPRRIARRTSLPPLHAPDVDDR